MKENKRERFQTNIKMVTYQHLLPLLSISYTRIATHGSNFNNLFLQPKCACPAVATIMPTSCETTDYTIPTSSFIMPA